MKKTALKKFCLITVFAFLVHFTKAQNVIKISLKNSKAPKAAKSQNPVSPPKKNNSRTVDWESLKKQVSQKSISQKSFLKIIDSLAVRDTAGTTPVDTSVTTAADSTVASADSIPKTDSSKKTSTDTGCDRINKIVDLVVKKNEEASYIFSLVDKNEDPVISFTIKQFNKQLVDGKIEKVLNQLCADTTDAKAALLTKLKEAATYDQIIEASLEVPDIDVLAGVLTVKKNVLSTSIGPAKNSNKDSSNLNQRQEKITRKAIIKTYNTIANQFDVNNYYNSYSQTDTVQAKKRGEFKQVIDNFVAKKKDSLKKAFNLNAKSDSVNFIVHNLQIQFEDGFIENLSVEGKLKDTSELITFSNNYPIPFSAKRNFITLDNEFVFNNKTKMKICLDDLLHYAPNFRPFTKDFFPDNSVYKIDLTQADTMPKINLLREKTSKILELKVYTDLKGVDSKNPNGLVQLEFEKQLNIWTRRFGKSNKLNYGWLNYFTPEFTLNKIEDNNKYLVLSTKGVSADDTSKPNIYTGSIDLLQHQEFKVGGLLNIFLLDLASFKSTLYVNMGAYFGRSLYQDTIRTKISGTQAFKKIDDNNVIQDGVNSFRFSPEIKWQVYPDERYGFAVTEKFSFFKAYTSKFSQVGDVEKYEKSFSDNQVAPATFRHGHMILTTEIFGFYSPSRYNKLFFRYRYNSLGNNAKYNFHQIQLGISTYLTNTKKDKPKQGE